MQGFEAMRHLIIISMLLLTITSSGEISDRLVGRIGMHLATMVQTNELAEPSILAWKPDGHGCGQLGPHIDPPSIERDDMTYPTERCPTSSFGQRLQGALAPLALLIIAIGLTVGIWNTRRRFTT